VKAIIPDEAPAEAVAVTFGLDDVAFIAVQPEVRATSWAADESVENFWLRT
jgi:hypothetical protein